MPWILRLTVISVQFVQQRKLVYQQQPIKHTASSAKKKTFRYKKQTATKGHKHSGDYKEQLFYLWVGNVEKYVYYLLSVILRNLVF